MLETFSHQVKPVPTVSLKQISIATFLGSSLAGGGLLALNFLENDEPVAAALIFLVSVLILVAVVAIPINPSIRSFIYPLTQMLVMRAIAKQIYNSEMLPEPDCMYPYPWMTVCGCVVAAIVSILVYAFGVPFLLA